MCCGLYEIKGVYPLSYLALYVAMATQPDTLLWELSCQHSQSERQFETND